MLKLNRMGRKHNKVRAAKGLLHTITKEVIGINVKPEACERFWLSDKVFAMLAKILQLIMEGNARVLGVVLTGGV